MMSNYCNNELNGSGGHAREEEQQGLQESSLDLSLLHVDSFNNSTTTTTNNNNIHRDHLPSCSSCGGTSFIASPATTSSTLNPKKRTEPHPKKPLILDHNHSDLSTFSKIHPLHPPTTTPQSYFPILRSCVSDPSISPRATASANQSPPETVNIVAASPLSKGSASASASGLPPKPYVLRRSTSDPNPSTGKTFKEESPSAKRLKRMQDCMKEMRKWFHEALHEEENIVTDQEAITKDDDEPEHQHEEEAVTVEREGECIVINFKCPCGKGYKILLLGGDCYYKLI